MKLYQVYRRISKRALQEYIHMVSTKRIVEIVDKNMLLSCFTDK